MKKKIMLLLLLGFSVRLARAQLVNAKPEEIKITCKVLKSLLDFDFKNTDYEKVLVTYMTYNHMNEICQVPPDMKLYMFNFFRINHKFIDQLNVSVNSTASKPLSTAGPKKKEAEFKSSMPFVVETSN